MSLRRLWLAVLLASCFVLMCVVYFTKLDRRPFEFAQYFRDRNLLEERPRSEQKDPALNRGTFALTYPSWDRVQTNGKTTIPAQSSNQTRQATAKAAPKTQAPSRTDNRETVQTTPAPGRTDNGKIVPKNQAPGKAAPKAETSGGARPDSAGKAVCVGRDPKRDEVDDVLCWPRPQFDPDIKNPCWWENVTIHSMGTQKVLRCLPYFHILGTSKAGTTDLFHRMSLHPHIVPNTGIHGKEHLYWSWSKYGYGLRGRTQRTQPFKLYIAGFEPIVRRLMGDPKDRTRLVTLDGSPPDMWDFRGWPQLPQNRGLRRPAVLTPHLMKHVYRDPKFVVLLRDPVERLYTAYYFHDMGESAQSFHKDVLTGIAQFDRCLASAPDRRECYFNSSVIDPIKIETSFACPAVHIKEWFAVFPRKHFLFMRTESYIQDVRGHLLKVFRFLDLSRPSEVLLNRMVGEAVTYHTKKKDTAGPMLPETRRILQDYVKACNEELAELLQDDQYLWKDVYSQSSNSTRREHV